MQGEGGANGGKIGSGAAGGIKGGSGRSGGDGGACGGNELASSETSERRRPPEGEVPSNAQSLITTLPSSTRICEPSDRERPRSSMGGAPDWTTRSGAPLAGGRSVAPGEPESQIFFAGVDELRTIDCATV